MAPVPGCAICTRVVFIVGEELLERVGLERFAPDQHQRVVVDEGDRA